ncbi:MAG: threonine synthase [Flavobacteriaceae bacterium]|nr:threonine synthase [Flavobacteriaceae bacterium]
MKYVSLTNNGQTASFKQAVIQGLAPDKGLYYPAYIPQWKSSFVEKIPELSNLEIALEAMRPFVDEDLNLSELEQLLDDVLSFEFPLQQVGKYYSLELFHGPTLAFKDVGAGFMAKCLGRFIQDEQNQKATVLVATSGDTGGAVANGFLGVEGIDVVILYPSGKVSPIQEKQLTTLGQNITALEVQGTFDDCQSMVKRAFVDPELTSKVRLTSANSINVARWIPQMLYYIFAYKTLKNMRIQEHPVFSVPSGNFGNICAGMLAHKMGLPVAHFIACNNTNDTVVDFMKTGVYRPKDTVATISNAMDVGNPSNFVRILELFNKQKKELEFDFTALSYSDSETKVAMQEIYNQFNYVADPHGAVAYLGLQAYMAKNPTTAGVFLETAHPSKFIDVVESTLDIEVSIPENVHFLMNREKQSILTSNYEDLKSFLLQ